MPKGETKPLSLILHGGAGRMGRAVLAVASRHPDVRIEGIIDPRASDTGDTKGGGLPVLEKIPADSPGAIVLDFSVKDAVLPLVRDLSGSGLKLVSGTTGLGGGQRKALEEYSQEQAVLYSENMSYGIAVMKVLLSVAAPLLRPAADVEVVETHHRHKQDYPSGTAFALAKEIDPTAGVTSGRGEERGRELGGLHVHSVRVGGVPGDHQVIFATEGEVLTLGHRALSREVFAEGALRAARFVAAKEAGLYTMDDLVREAHG